MDLSHDQCLRRIGAAPEVKASTVVGSGCIRLNLDEPRVVVASQLDMAPFIRGAIVYPCEVDPRFPMRPPGHAMVRADGSASVRFPDWKVGQDVLPVNQLLRENRKLGLRAELHGTEVVFLSNEGRVSGVAAVNSLIDQHIGQRIPVAFQNAPSRIVEVVRGGLEDPKIILCDSIEELEARIEAFIPWDAEDGWRYAWRENLRRWNGRHFDLQIPGASLRSMKHDGGFSLTVGSAHGWGDLESMCGAIPHEKRSTLWVRGKLFLEMDPLRRSVVDFRRALAGSAFDWELAAKAASHEADRASEIFVLAGAQGVYSARLLFGHHDANPGQDYRWRHSDGRVLVFAQEEPSRTFLSISVAPVDGVPAGNGRMIHEMAEMRDEFLRCFVESHGKGDVMRHCSLPQR